MGPQIVYNTWQEGILMATGTSLRGFLTNIYGYTFFNSLMLLSPVYAVFMQENGVSDMGISALLIIWSAGVLLTQFPVTWAAKKCGAKNILFAGQILKVIAFILWVIWPCFAGFAIGMLLWGMHGAIYNVISEDVLYDELQARKHANVYARILGRRKNIASIGTALSAAGSLLLFFGYEIITAATVVSLALSMLFVTRLRLIEEYKGIQGDGNSMLKSIKTSISAMRQRSAIIAMLALSVLITNFSYLNDYLSLIGYDIGLRPEYIGIVPFFILCCQVVGQTIAHRFANTRPLYIYAMIIASGALFGMFAFQYNMTALPALGAAYVICSIIKIVLYARFQDMTPSRYRMEFLSFYSIADQSSYMLVCLIIGLGSLIGGWRYSVMLLGAGLVLLGLWAMIFAHRRKRKCSMPDAAPMITMRPSGPDVI